MNNMVSYEHKKSNTRPYSGSPSQEGKYKGAKQHYDSYAAYRAPPTERPRGPRFSNEANARVWEDGYQRNSNSSTNATASSTGSDSLDLESHSETYPYMHEIADPQNNTVYNDAAYPSHYSQPGPQYPYQQFGSNVYQNPAAASAPSLGTLSSEEESDIFVTQQYTHYPQQHLEYSQNAHSQQLQYSQHAQHYQFNGYSYPQQTHSEYQHPLYAQVSHTGPPPQIAVQTVHPYEGRSQSLTSRSFSKSGRRSPQPISHYMPNMAQNSATSTKSMSINGVSNLIIPSYADDNIPPRRSMESVRERPKPPLTNQRTERFRSFSYSDASPSSVTPEASSPSSPSSIGKQHIPIVYPALLSRVAEAFRVRVTLSNRMKDNLEYKDCFDGREAVDKIAFIIKTTDRNLALLLGRALDSQKFFHDVTYDHRLRDSPNELYQFQKMPSILSLSENFNELEDDIEEEEIEENDLPNGVFTLLTDCYSPTCTRDSLCYSIACPRRLEQHARKNMKPNPGLKRAVSRGSISDKKDQKLWVHTVPPEIANSVSEAEKKRQEAINEVIYTEKDFVRDLEYLRDCWMNPLLNQNITLEPRRKYFVNEVFSNILEVHGVNSKLADALQKRQNSYAIVEQIGDIFLEFAPLFDPFIKYGARQLWGKYEFEREKNSNSVFAKFVEETERRPESRKLELNGYLTKPTTRLGRYPLLLEAILKQTPQGHPDSINLPKVIKIIREFLTNVNVESGKSENRFNLQQLNDQLIQKGEHIDLGLTEEGRQLIFKGSLKRRGGGGESDLQVFLFDHALLMVKAKTVNKVEQYKIHRKPIPLALLSVSATESPSEGSRANARRPPSILPGKAQTVVRGSNDRQYALTFCRLGKKSFIITLYSNTYIGRRKWVEHIEKQKEIINDKGKVFEKEILLEKRNFSGPNKVNCGAFFDNYSKLAFGTDLGIYVLEIGPNSKPAVRVIQLERVSQIDILEEFRLLLALADKNLFSYPLESLDPSKSKEANKRSTRISSSTSFFKSGTCLGKTLVTIVKNSSLNSTIKTLEPIEQNIKNKNKSPLKILSGRSDSLKTYKEFYIPTELTSVNFLSKKLCVGCCAKGFEIVDLETLITQSLIDPEDMSLDFVQKKENVKPIAIYRISGGDFLLCYDEFAFYVNKVGWRSRPNWLITWEGSPTSFALRYPYVLAFEPSFIEIRHVETGALEQIIEGHNMRCLYSDSRGNILVVTTDQGTDSSEAFSLKLVDGRRSSLISEATSIATSVLAYEDGNTKLDNDS